MLGEVVKVGAAQAVSCRSSRGSKRTQLLLQTGLNAKKYKTNGVKNLRILVAKVGVDETSQGVCAVDSTA
jgi:hypothetical protein